MNIVYLPSCVAKGYCDWAKFGREAEGLCKSLGLDYYIKDSLRREMEKGGDPT